MISCSQFIWQNCWNWPLHSATGSYIWDERESQPDKIGNQRWRFCHWSVSGKLAGNGQRLDVIRREMVVGDFKDSKGNGHWRLRHGRNFLPPLISLGHITGWSWLSVWLRTQTMCFWHKPTHVLSRASLAQRWQLVRIEQQHLDLEQFESSCRWSNFPICLFNFLARRCWRRVSCN